MNTDDKERNQMAAALTECVASMPDRSGPAPDFQPAYMAAIRLAGLIRRHLTQRQCETATLELIKSSEEAE